MIFQLDSTHNKINSRIQLYFRQAYSTIKYFRIVSKLILEIVNYLIMQNIFMEILCFQQKIKLLFI